MMQHLPMIPCLEPAVTLQHSLANRNSCLTLRIIDIKIAVPTVEGMIHQQMIYVFTSTSRFHLDFGHLDHTCSIGSMYTNSAQWMRSTSAKSKGLD